MMSQTDVLLQPNPIVSQLNDRSCIISITCKQHSYSYLPICQHISCPGLGLLQSSVNSLHSTQDVSAAAIEQARNENRKALDRSFGMASI